MPVFMWYALGGSVLVQIGKALIYASGYVH